eukprot:358824-Prymnesium_polylepis.1
MPPRATLAAAVKAMSELSSMLTSWPSYGLWPICGCPIWDFLCVPARYDAQFRGRFLGPRGFSLPLTGVTAH